MTLPAALLAAVFAHMVGDYALQTTWMAQEKTHRFVPACVHALTYGAAFVPVLGLLCGWASLVHPGSAPVGAWLVIVGTHAVLDRYRLPKYLIYARNQLAPRRYRYPWADADAHGFPPGTPAYLSTWLLVIVDNLIHVAINSAALWWAAPR